MASDRALSARDGGMWSGGGMSGGASSARHLRMLPPPPAYEVAPAPLRLTVRGRRVVVVLLLLVAMGATAGAGALLDGAAEGLELMGASRVVVEPGDTLWSIASGVAGERDVRVVVDGIQLLNGLDSAFIEPGQVLELPRAPGR